MPKRSQKAHQLAASRTQQLLLSWLQNSAGTLAGAGNKHVDLPVLRAHKGLGETNLFLACCKQRPQSEHQQDLV